MFGFGGLAVRPFAALRVPSANMLGTGDLAATLQYSIYAATREFATEPTDTLLPNRPFYGTLEQPLAFTRSILGSDIIGRFVAGSGEIDVKNVDAFYDFLIQGYAIDGRPISVKVGEVGTDSSTWVTIFSGIASDFSVLEDKLTVLIQDNSYKLNVPIQTRVYAGTGGIEGGTDIAGKAIPLCFGYVQYMTPVLVQSSSLLYHVHDGQVQSITVYDRAVALTLDADYANSTLLLAATIASGKYATCLAEGFFRLNNILDNAQIAADVQGDKTGGVFVSTAADIIRRIIARTSALVDPTDLYVPGFSAVNAAQPAQLNYHVTSDSNATINDVFVDIMASVGGWAGFRRDGAFTIAIFNGPDVVPSLSLQRIDERNIKRDKLPSALSPPPAKWRVGWGKNWTSNATALAGATDAQRAFVADEYRYATAEAVSIRSDHPFTRDPDPVRGYFRNAADALTEANRLLALYRVVRAIYHIDVGTEPFALNLGETVNVTYPRWDLATGRNLLLVEITEDAASGACTIGCYG